MASPLDRRRFASLAALAWAFAAHLWGRLRAWLNRRPRPGLAAFAESYRKDGITFATPEDRALAPALGECTACRACDPVCPVVPASAGRGFIGPSRLVLSSARLPTAAASAWPDPFLCIRCGACDRACPQGVPLDAMIGGMRRTIAASAPEAVPPGLRELLGHASLRGHLEGAPPAAPRREDGLQHDRTYVPSCAASSSDVAAEAALLEAAGIDYGTAPARCCGAVGARGLGERWTGLAEALAAGKALHVVTADPRCYEHLRTSPLYKDLIVEHVLELAAAAPAAAPPAKEEAKAGARAGKPGEKAALERAAAALAGVTEALAGPGAPAAPPVAGPPVTFHDPCQLARVPGGPELAREAIRRSGADLREMRRAGRDAPCCGMGGSTYGFLPELAEELGRARVREAAATGAEVLLTQSPLCRDHLARCAAKEGARLAVKNVTEMLAERLAPEAASAARPLGTGPGATSAAHPERTRVDGPAQSKGGLVAPPEPEPPRAPSPDPEAKTAKRASPDPAKPEAAQALANVITKEGH